MMPRPTKFFPVAGSVASRAASLLAMMAAVAGISGCASRRAPTFPFGAVALAHPRIPPKPAMDPAEMSPPDLAISIPPPNLSVSFGRTVPARPRIPAGTTADLTPEAPVEAPVIAPQLSENESAAARQQTRESIAAAERNLARVGTRELTPLQADLAAKVRGFLKNAREAAGSGDWVGAHNLAEKAQLLSEELVRSL